uniref:Calmodulin-lysine N-methyltransferase n=1 Tax=Dunaliella tertiolecta TaxID=3047 RepID=A0A6S8LMT6_DUNTE
MLARLYRLVEYLSNLRENFDGCTVLELGAGLGYLGLTIARNTLASLVCLTEQAEGGALHWCRFNVERNRHLPNSNIVRTCECDWRDYVNCSTPSELELFTKLEGCQTVQGSSAGFQHQQEHSKFMQMQEHYLQQAHQGSTKNAPRCHDTCNGKEADRVFLTSTNWDYIVGSDLVYNSVGSTVLPLVLKKLCSPTTVILYCHTKHRFDHLDVEFFEQLDKVGFNVEEVREPCIPTPPPSPPPLTELFPEQRIAIYRISCKLQSSNMNRSQPT